MNKYRLNKFLQLVIIIFAVCLLITSNYKVLAEVETSAQRLHELGIVNGDGTSFLEDKTLTRAESLALIMRLVEKEDYTISHKFSDVKESDWFYSDVMTAYSMGIVAGFPDNTFRPNESVSRNSFLKMLLEVLGYDYGSDYLWKEVEKLSSIVGIIDTELKTDYDLLRGESFDFITSLLELVPKDGDDSYINTLLDESLITEEAYINYRENMSFSSVKLKNIRTPKSNYVLVELSDTIQLVQENLIVSLQSGADRIVVDNQSKVKIFNDSLHIDLSDFENSNSEWIYCQGLVDEYGAEIEAISFPYNISIAEIDYEYYLTDIRAVGQQLIQVDFSHPVKAETLSVKNFRVTKNNKNVFFNIAQLSDHQIVIALHDPINLEDEISLMIVAQLNDIYSNVFLDGLSIFYDVAIEKDVLNQLQIESVNSIGNNVIRVVYNQPVDASSGLNRGNYQVNDLSRGNGYKSVLEVVNTGVGELLNRQFDVNFGDFIDGNSYYFKATNIYTIGVSTQLEQQQMKFVYKEEAYAFNVNSVSILDSQHIRVNMNMLLDQEDIDVAIMKVDGYDTYRNVLSEDKMSIDIYTEKALEVNESYNVYIEGLKSSVGLEMTKKSISFTSSSQLRGDLDVEVTYNSYGHMIVTFKEDIKALSEGLPLRIYKKLKDGKESQLTNEAYDIVDSSTLILYEDQESVESYTIYDVYLAGDDFYVGSVNVVVSSK